MLWIYQGLLIIKINIKFFKLFITLYKLQILEDKLFNESGISIEKVDRAPIT